MRNVSNCLVMPGHLPGKKNETQSHANTVMDEFILPAMPAWISVVRELDSEHYIYIEQRTVNPETLFSTANPGLRFNTQDWSVFGIQVQGITETLKLQDAIQRHETQRLLSMGGFAGMCTDMLAGQQTEQPTDKKLAKTNK